LHHRLKVEAGCNILSIQLMVVRPLFWQNKAKFPNDLNGEKVWPSFSDPAKVGPQPRWQLAIDLPLMAASLVRHWGLRSLSDNFGPGRPALRDGSGAKDPNRNCDAAGKAAMKNAHGYGHNDFKIPLARRTLRAALAEATGTI
jgi:hypothetical protein